MEFALLVIIVMDLLRQLVAQVISNHQRWHQIVLSVKSVHTVAIVELDKVL
jgi:hypothetical protein